jgi:hypothetical protein
MNNFELHKQAEILSDTLTPSKLAREYLTVKEELLEAKEYIKILKQELSCVKKSLGETNLKHLYTL